MLVRDLPEQPLVELVLHGFCSDCLIGECHCEPDTEEPELTE